jgi:hypothetical protein
MLIIDGRGMEDWFPEYDEEIKMDQELKQALIADAMQEREKEDAIELALVCAQGIVEAWPTMTMRTLGEMTNRIDTLRQALEAANK